MPTDTEIVYIPRDQFDAVCSRFHLTPEPVYAEGWVEARYRKTVIYRSALTTEEKS